MHHQFKTIKSHASMYGQTSASVEEFVYNSPLMTGNTLPVFPLVFTQIRGKMSSLCINKSYQPRIT